MHGAPRRGTSLKVEAIEIGGNVAKVQAFEDTRGVRRIHLSSLAPTFSSGARSWPSDLIVDGLQNPLERVADATGLFLSRGVYLPPLDRSKHWGFPPTAKVGETLCRGDSIGFVMEGRFHHQIMVPLPILASTRSIGS